MRYHGGLVMHRSTTYALYWTGPERLIPSSYEHGIDRFLGSVAAESGGHGNVYSATVEYGDASGVAAYENTFGGAYQDTSSIPTDGCYSPLTDFCVSDGEIRKELDSYVSAHQLPRGLSNMYLVFLPREYGTCGENSCAYTQFCAYHSSFGRGSGLTLWANLPWDDYEPGEGSGKPCGIPPSPNGDLAVDHEVSTVSHEQIETMTDPVGGGWVDDNGEEIADKCAYRYGPPLGNTEFAQYNQVIGGQAYELQLEWSNAASGCVARSSVEPPPDPPNDLFNQAQALSGRADRRNADTNFEAGKEPGEPSHAGNEGGASIWYRWRAPANGMATVATTGSSFDTLLAVYVGSSVSRLFPISSNDDFNEEGNSLVRFIARAHTTYRIAVDGYNEEGNPDGGTVHLQLSEKPPPGTRIFGPHWVSTGEERARIRFRLLSIPGGAQFECTLDSHPFRHCPRRFAIRARPGHHVLRARAVTGADLVDPTPARFPFFVARH